MSDDERDEVMQPSVPVTVEGGLAAEVAARRRSPVDGGVPAVVTDGEVSPCWACRGAGSRVSGGMVYPCPVCGGARSLPADPRDRPALAGVTAAAAMSKVAARRRSPVDGGVPTRPVWVTDGEGSGASWQWLCVQGCDVAVSGYHARRRGRVLCERVGVVAARRHSDDDRDEVCSVSAGRPHRPHGRCPGQPALAGVTAAAAAVARVAPVDDADPVERAGGDPAGAGGPVVDGVAAPSVRVEWGWSVSGGGPVSVRGESAAWDLAHRYEGSRVWRRLVGPWSEVSDGG